MINSFFYGCRSWNLETVSDLTNATQQEMVEADLDRVLFQTVLGTDQRSCSSVRTVKSDVLDLLMWVRQPWFHHQPKTMMKKYGAVPGTRGLSAPCSGGQLVSERREESPVG